MIGNSKKVGTKNRAEKSRVQSARAVSAKNMRQENNLTIEYLVFNRILEISEQMPGKIIRFPSVFGRICPLFCLTKSQAWLVLKSMERLGWIEIVPFQGIRIPTERKNTRQGHLSGITSGSDPRPL